MLFSGFHMSCWEHYLSHNDRGWANNENHELCRITALPPLRLVSCSDIPLCCFRHSLKYLAWISSNASPLSPRYSSKAGSWYYYPRGEERKP